MRLTGIFFLAALLLWGTGLIAFGLAIPRQNAKAEQTTDAIVVLTGGTHRITTGLSLFRSSAAPRLFISGVHESVLYENLVQDRERADRVELGYEAHSTRQNVAEVRQWIHRYNIRSLRLVTSNYHMPRSLVLFRAAFPDVRLIPHPVTAAHLDFSRWWTHTQTARLVFSEYHKFLVSYLATVMGTI